MPLTVDSSAYRAPAFSVPGERSITGYDELGNPQYGEPTGGGMYLSNASRVTGSPKYFDWQDQLEKGNFEGFTKLTIPAASSGHDNKSDAIARLNEIGFVPQGFSTNPWGQTGYVPNELAQYIVKPYDANPKSDSDFMDTLLKVAPIVLMAAGIPDFFSALTGGAAMGTETAGLIGGWGDLGGFGGGASWGDLSFGDISSWGNLGGYGGGGPNWGDLGNPSLSGGWGDLGGFGGGSNWGDFSLGDLGDWGNLGGYGGGADWGPSNYAPEVDLSRPYTDWGKPDMGATFANWLSNPMDMLKKLRSMSPLAQNKGGPLQGGINVLSGLNGIRQSRMLADLARRSSERADPFGPYREGYAQQLAALSANPSLITKQPGYAAGLEAVRRSLAAQGYQGSGNMMAALAQYGQKFLGDEQNRLATLAGAGFNPASAGQLNLEGNISAAQLLGSSLNRLAGGAFQLFR